MENGREKYPRTFVKELVVGKPKWWKKMKYYLRSYGFRIGVSFLAFGFAVQLVAEFHR
ncbi:MAG: hypothetical protein HY221_00990 [Candidatus Sungbacteria bacterium]|uniref:Uncharacterized protein n=1 Tax=Candidatus Sungiibacteriota bacterium TaxID=2750080 RepID=A0A932VPI3_9BACT|nr:hypothetical protein [Candidatus Sungbacteria bacterium]